MEEVNCSVRKMFCYAVDELMNELADNLHPVVDDLLLKLYSEFTEQERQNINNSGTSLNKIVHLFESLKTKSSDAHQKCLKALEELKHKEMADKLKENMNKSSSPRIVTGN